MKNVNFKEARLLSYKGGEVHQTNVEAAQDAQKAQESVVQMGQLAGDAARAGLSWLKNKATNAARYVELKARQTGNDVVGKVARKAGAVAGAQETVHNTFVKIGDAEQRFAKNVAVGVERNVNRGVQYAARGVAKAAEGGRAVQRGAERLNNNIDQEEAQIAAAVLEFHQDLQDGVDKVAKVEYGTWEAAKKVASNAKKLGGMLFEGTGQAYEQGSK